MASSTTCLSYSHCCGSRWNGQAFSCILLYVNWARCNAKRAAAVASSQRLFSVVSRVMLKDAPSRSSLAMVASWRILGRTFAVGLGGFFGCRVFGAFGFGVSTWAWTKSLLAVVRA